MASETLHSDFARTFTFLYADLHSGEGNMVTPPPPNNKRMRHHDEVGPLV
jgi:hypothetical protein